MIVAVDFDGTCVTHEYPSIGQSIGAEDWLRRAVIMGAHLILFTMRDGVHLDAAVEWFHVNGIRLWAVNENPPQREWTRSPKVYAHSYIDDAALGVPLIYPDEARPYVDWNQVGPKLLEMLARC